VGTGHTGVQVQRSSIDRAWKVAGGDDTWLLLRTKSGSIAHFEAAVHSANAAAKRRGEGDDVFAEAPASSPLGFAALLSHAAFLESVHRWVADFVALLEARGFSGRLGGAPERKPIALMASGLPPVPTAFLAWSLDHAAIAAGRNQYWGVAADATARIAALADRWARLPAAQLILRQNIYDIAVDLDDAAAPLARSVSESGMAGIRFFRKQDQHVTNVSLAFGGQGVFQVVSPENWQQRIARLRDALIALPVDTEQGFIRPGLRGTLTNAEMDAAQPLPGLKEHDVRYNKHLLDRYLPDAHGIQVVRTAHLDNAHNLTDWHITDLGHGRHLVQAHDLTPWYANPLPDPELHTQARTDFAGTLLTLQIITDNPAPQ
jgi:hypothetical protein